MTDHQLHSAARLTARFAWVTAKRLWHQAIAEDIGEIVAGIWARTMLEALVTYQFHGSPVEISNPNLEEPRP